MNSRKNHALHSGELSVQKRHNTPEELTMRIPDFVEADMPAEHANFYSELPYLPLATLDVNGRPWVNLLVTQAQGDASIGVKVTGQNRLSVVAEAVADDPFIRSLRQTQLASARESALFAGVGIDFSNRRRNKFSGRINSVELEPSGRIGLNLSSDQHLGNCPKYITVRSLEYHQRNAQIVFDHFETLNVELPKFSKALINEASTLFLATKHTSKDVGASQSQQDMGLNHRGGTPGFVRLYQECIEENVTTFLTLPDHSGNRFYQSLGNIETDKQVGLIFPDFNTGDLLYLTGDAENLFDEDAEQLMPRVRLLTRIKLTGAVHIKQGLNLKMVSAERLSPYNPPVRYLKHELEQMGHLSNEGSPLETPMSAKLIAVERLTANVSTFTFQLPKAINLPAPGGFGVFDFSQLIKADYQHMNDNNPQVVNDDYIRTWTLSSAANFDPLAARFCPVDKIKVTVKRKPGGLISNLLHQNCAPKSLNPRRIINPNFKGTGAGFSCFSTKPDDGLPVIPSKMLWVAGGVGITPFMAMWDGILQVARKLPNRAELDTDIILLFAGRDDDIYLLKPFLHRAASLPSNIRLRVFAFQSMGHDASSGNTSYYEMTQEFPRPRLEIVQRRLQESDLRHIEHLTDREAFLCGPLALMETTTAALKRFGGPNLKIHQESFFF
ncbi:hypothetical protein [Vibrio sp. WXL103]|uniref:hypothetical protein n=1 Tax=Vibrio sp. WXL103 TaxID=3450710 RepID=UPI003EC6B596